MAIFLPGTAEDQALAREEMMEEVEDKAELAAEDRLIDLLLPPTPSATAAAAVHEPGSNVIQLPAATPEADSRSDDKPGDREQRTREKLRQQFREGKLDE